MKKTLALALLPVAAVLVLSGCGRTAAPTPEAADATAPVTQQADMPQPAPAALSDVAVDPTVAPITKDTSVDTTLKDVDAAVSELQDM